MPLIIGTGKGVYQASDPSLGRIERLLDDVKVYDLAWSEGTLYVAAESGLYRSPDRGEEWAAIDVPADEVTSVATSPDGSHAYVGTMPEHVYVSTDGGDSWQERESLQELPSRDKWFQRGSHHSHVRTLGVHPDVPDRVVVGVDGGGVHVSDDRGETWESRMTGITAYVHHLLPLGPDEYLAATDAGVFWTTDCGRWWDFQYDDDVTHRYFRGAFSDGENVYAGGSRASVGGWGEDGPRHSGFYELRFGVEGRRKPIVRVPYPGEPDELVLSGTEFDGHLFAGTTGGKLLHRRDDGSWETALTLPGGVQLRHMIAPGGG